VTLPSCASVSHTATTVERKTSASDIKQQFFTGTIQRSSFNGQTKYGPAFASLVRRSLDLESGRIIECVLQEGKFFVTEILRTDLPLVFEAKDLSGSFVGKLLY
jgi:hypothetical protein